VELAVPATTLRALREDLTGLDAWAEVVTDLLRQLERGLAGDEYYAGEAHRRAPGAGLHRYLEIRDRSCTMIGCRAPARTADKDPQAPWRTVTTGYRKPATWLLGGQVEVLAAYSHSEQAADLLLCNTVALTNAVRAP
jgi:hypothetical protein